MLKPRLRYLYVNIAMYLSIAEFSTPGIFSSISIMQIYKMQDFNNGPVFWKSVTLPALLNQLQRIFQHVISQSKQVKR